MYTIDDLLYLMSRLRDSETGCPWDKKQTFSSIAPFTVEETYEVVDAIERQAFSELPAELGDLLFQVVFYAQMAKEDQLFNFSDIVQSIVAKLIRRHPHVFSDGQLYGEKRVVESTEDEIRENWQKIKQQEQLANSGEKNDSLFSEITTGLPPLMKAVKLQQKAASVGFDWSDWHDVVHKLEEELEELQQARQTANQDAIEDELGDVFFVCVNMARHLGIDPEQALRRANRKFDRRFRYIEQHASQEDLTSVTLSEMESLWSAAKQHE